MTKDLKLKKELNAEVMLKFKGDRISYKTEFVHRDNPWKNYLKQSKEINHKCTSAAIVAIYLS